MGRVRNNLAGIDSEASVANRHLGEIKRQRAVNRLILYGVIGLIGVAVIAIVALKVVNVL